ncbi:MAG: outer membrane beta-barrel protein [Bacteroidetes bacterium]|nr:outer membrane beta-barrel protein [Bacteroidota bacterium]
MKKRFALPWVILFLAFVLAPIVASAQADPDELDDPLNPKQPHAKLLIGPRVGVNRNYHTGGFLTIQGENCPKFQSGSGWGFLAGITAEFIPGTSWSIVPAVTYESRPGNFKQQLPDVLVLLDGVGVTQTVSATSDITYQLLSAEVMYKQEIWTPAKAFRMSVAAGPVFSYVLGGKNTQYQDLDQPANARFLNPDGLPTGNNGRRLIYADNIDIPGRNAIRFSLKAGLQFEVGLFHNKIMMYPGVFYDYGLTNVTSSENWGLNSILFQVDFRRAF